MSKELDEIKRIITIHFGALGFLNPSENEQILKDRDKVLNALNELKSIKEANPSEALKSFDYVLNKAFDYGIQATLYNLAIRGYDTEKMLEKQDYLGNRLDDDLDKAKKWLINLKNDNIKQVLLKAQENENKKYLKWEDLEFKEEEQKMKVILNGSIHHLCYFRNMFGTSICIIDNTDITIRRENKDFFNDLHLEVAEDE